MFSLEEAEFEPVSADCQVSKLPLCCHHGPKWPGTKVKTLCHLQSLAFLCTSKVPDNIMMCSNNVDTLSETRRPAFLSERRKFEGAFSLKKIVRQA